MRTTVRLVNAKDYAFLSATPRATLRAMSTILHQRIRKRLKDLQKSPQQASLEAGLSRDFLRTLFNRDHGSPRSDSLAKLAKVLETTPDWLLGAESEKASPEQASPRQAQGADLPVYGLAAGSVLGHLAMSDQPVEWVTCPPGLAKVRDAYALIVTGSSMEPRYSAGDMVFVHPYRPPRQGDHIIIQEARQGETVTFIKRFEKWTDGHLVTSQYNPLGEVRFDRKAIIAIHRVLTTNELFGI